jgi:Helix-turn-helix domain
MAPETSEISAGGHGGALPTPTVLQGFITAAELAAQIHRSVRTLARWRALGEGPPVTRIGREILYKKSSVAAWLASLEQDA